VAAASRTRAGVRFGLTGRALSPARLTHGPKACCPGKAVSRVTRRGAPARWASPVARPWPWRAWVRPASSHARKHLQPKRSRHEGRFTAKRNTPPRRLTQTRRGVIEFPAHRAARLSHEHRQQMVGAARPWRWGALPPPPRSPPPTAQNNLAPCPKHRTRGAARAWCRARRRGAGKPSVPCWGDTRKIRITTLTRV
jgi:hypothetical protein